MVKPSSSKRMSPRRPLSKTMISQTVETSGRRIVLIITRALAHDLGSSCMNFPEVGTVININLKSVWLCMKYKLIQMLAQGVRVVRV